MPARSRAWAPRARQIEKTGHIWVRTHHHPNPSDCADFPPSMSGCLDSVGVGPAFVLETVLNLAEEIPERARKVAAELRERHGDFPAAEMILPLLRKRGRRILQLVRQ